MNISPEDLQGVTEFLSHVLVTEKHFSLPCIFEYNKKGEMLGISCWNFCRFFSEISQGSGIALGIPSRVFPAVFSEILSSSS